ncbi:hypothetical protein FRB95_007066 [Tulasnella sp. JGI-2019a]|nr:hypothetical protein FRB95_007066 [Tulasnella sp. JGI-2019a]
MKTAQPAENILNVATSTAMNASPVLFLTEKRHRKGTEMVLLFEPSSGRPGKNRLPSDSLNVPVSAS